MTKRVLVINLGWEQVPLIEHLLARGDCVLYGVHYNDHPERSEAFEHVLTADIRDLETIFNYADNLRPDAVISDQCDYSLLAQAAIAAQHHLPGPTLKAAQLSNNKFLQRETAKASGVLIPAYQLCLCEEDANAFAQRVGFPIILKPTDNRGSFGVVKVTSRADISVAFYTALANSHSRCVLAEEFIDGIQITVDGYAFPEAGCKSVAVGTKLMSDGNAQVALGIIYPGNLSQTLRAQAMALNAWVNERLGFVAGMTHSEYMIRDENLYLIESANRGGGVFTSELIAPTSSGIDLLSQYTSDCIGEAADFYAPPAHAPVVLRFFSFRPGTIQHIIGWSEVQSDPRVMSARLMVSEGDEIQPISTDANRHGFLVVRGTQGDAEELLSRVRIDYA
jgi:biotin carboxylase